MITDITYKLLKEYGQEHLIAGFDGLSAEEKENLSAQLNKTDFTLINKIDELLSARAGSDISPIDAMTLPMIRKNQEAYRETGLAEIRKGKLAAVLLAGGQGTRLGVDKSKGLVNIGITRELFIFECLINNMLDVVKAADAWIPLYIMTSSINNAAIIEFLKEKNFFGYNPDYVTFFEQETCPAVSFERKILMSSPSELALSPNGNGGWYKSMRTAGITKELKEKGIEWLNTFSVDNVLQRIADPVFFGAVLENGCDCGSKVIRKASPEEKVGVMCLRGGKPSVVEYTELSETMRYEKNAEGELNYNFGVTLNYLFRTDKLDELLDADSTLHIAVKKIPYMNEQGEKITPEENNGYKFETFIIDMIEHMDKCLVFEVEREKEFAPIKNKEGNDSIDTARALLVKNGVVL